MFHSTFIYLYSDYSVLTLYKCNVCLSYRLRASPLWMLSSLFLFILQYINIYIYLYMYVYIHMVQYMADGWNNIECSLNTGATRGYKKKHRNRCLKEQISLMQSRTMSVRPSVNLNLMISVIDGPTILCFSWYIYIGTALVLSYFLRGCDKPKPQQNE